jgi:hypothetical protein
MTDLLQSVLFDDVANLCVNLSEADRFSKYKATNEDRFVEVFATGWYRSTHQSFVNNHDLDNTNHDFEVLMPLIFYIDETGTDAFQRYPLEPLMFTFAIIRRHMREKSSSWRHAGFVPKVGDFDNSLEALQIYHDCLSALLADLVDLQSSPPIVVLNLGGIKKRVKLILEVAFVMGDQKSQDTLCACKKSNGGGAARIHRGCMCSSIHGSDSITKCKPVSKQILDHLRDISFEDYPDSVSMTTIRTKLPPTKRGNGVRSGAATLFIKRRARLARDILSRTYTMHAIRNAFDLISFGTNSNKIFSATLDDPLHFCNSGLFEYMGKVGYLGMQLKEREYLESIILSQLRGVRSSVKNEFPRTRHSKGMSNMTLLPADEKVGMNFTMLLALHNDDAKVILEKAFQRQQTKYMTFYIPTRKSKSPTALLSEDVAEASPVTINRKNKAPCNSVTPAPVTDPHALLQFPLRNHCYFAQQKDNYWPRTQSSAQFIFLHLKRHGFSFILEQDYDQLQLEYLFLVSWQTLN